MSDKIDNYFQTVKAIWAWTNLVYWDKKRDRSRISRMDRIEWQSIRYKQGLQSNDKNKMKEFFIKISKSSLDKKAQIISNEIEEYHNLRMILTF